MYRPAWIEFCAEQPPTEVLLKGSNSPFSVATSGNYRGDHAQRSSMQQRESFAAGEP